MLCDACNTKTATVFLTQIIHGKVKKLNLCAACSQQQGVEESMEFVLSDLFQGLGAMKERSSPALPSLICSACGYSEKEFKKRGRLGCSSCYDLFSEPLTPMLRSMHGDVIHKGKIPAKIAAANQHAHELEALRSTLAAAIKSERYEEAILHRDRIALLEQAAMEEGLKKEVDLKLSPTKEKIGSLLSTTQKRALGKASIKVSASQLTEQPPEQEVSSS